MCPMAQAITSTKYRLNCIKALIINKMIMCVCVCITLSQFRCHLPSMNKSEL